MREGSLYMYLFVVAMVLFVIMTAAFFINNASKGELAVEREKFETMVVARDRSIEQLARELASLRELVAGSGYGDPEQWLGDDHIRANELKGKAEKAVNAALQDLGEDSREFVSLTGVYSDLDSLLLKLRQAREEAFQARQASAGELVQVKQAQEAANTEGRENLNRAQQRVTELEAANEDLDNQLKEAKAAYVREIEMVKSDCSDERITLRRQIDFKNNQISNLQQRLDLVQAEIDKEKNFDDVEPDGTLLTVLGASGKGWINLGRENHLQKGLVFRVFQYIKGGKKQPKGRVEVVKVDETMSEVRIVEELDPLNPITTGDYLSSPFYDPEMSPVFVFAGQELTSKSFTREGLIAKMASYGAVVAQKVDLETDYLVATRDYESTEEYKAARDLGVTVIRERDLLEFIGR